MAEAVRLVVWDLDETFWRGTLTEGGHAYVDAHHDIVVELARRGIMSSICSKNDHARVEAILRERGIWDYFIFPSIDWSPKGPRIAALVETVQLRPASVLFIDDNPQNLREALHFTPGLQVETEAFIPRLLDDPRFGGKDDRGLTRLRQYKVLERRKADEVAATAAEGSNVEFLRRSGIRVRLEFDVEAHIDRAVELINRTNQLNFTKARLPEEPEAARAALRAQLGHHLAQGGLVHVADDYGDYGYCGFFLSQARPDGNRLLHFCFSCRILDMGVEAWLYQRLGRPALRARGEVLSDPVAAGPVDWIRLVEDGAENSAAPAPAQAGASSVAMRGGCVMLPLTHYLSRDAASVSGEFNTMRDGISIRLDHSLCFLRAMEGMPEAAMNGWSLLGYRPEDFRSRFFEHRGPQPIWVFSNWIDASCMTHVHRKTGVRLPVNLPPARRATTQALRHAHFYLQELFEPAGVLTEREIKDNMRLIFSRVPAHGRLFAVLSLESGRVDGREVTVAVRARLNAWTREVAGEFATVEALPVADFIEQEGDVVAGSAMGHFDRMVYHRMYQRIRARMAEPARAAA